MSLAAARKRCRLIPVFILWEQSQLFPFAFINQKANRIVFRHTPCPSRPRSHLSHLKGESPFSHSNILFEILIYIQRTLKFQLI